MSANPLKRYAALCVMAAVFVSSQVRSETIVPGDYAKSVMIRFDGYSGTTTLSNFPALIRFGEGVEHFSFSDFESDDYSDLRFTKDDGVTAIPFEVEQWQSTAPTASVPTNIPGCQVWFRADDGVLTNESGSVTNWLDRSGNGRNALNATAAEQPIVQPNALNSLPAVRFDGAGDRLFYNGTFLAGTDYTIFIVEGRLDTSVNWILRGSAGSPDINHNLIIGYRDNTTFTHAQYGNDYDMTVAGFTAQEFNVFTVDSGVSAKHTWRNGALLGSRNDSTKLVSYNGATIGGQGAYTGDIAEVIIYNRTLNAVEMAAVHLYLEEKYAIDIEIDTDAARTASVWVQVPELTNNAAIFAYWGNAAATELPVYTTNGLTWAEAFGGAWHMNEVNPLDSTTNLNHGVASNTPDLVPAVVEHGLKFVETSQEDVRVADSASISASGDFTASLWFRSTMGAGWYQNLMGNFGASGASTTFWGLGWVNPSDLGFIVRVASADTRISAGALNDDKWHHLTGQKEGDTMRLFVDGQLVGTGTRPGSAYNGKQLVFCNHNGDYTSAAVDEARFSNAVRSPDWIKAEYDNQRDPAAFSYIDRDYFYDTATDAALQAGDGAWSSGVANWSVDAAGSDPLAVWLDGATAHFTAGGVSTVSVAAVRTYGMSVGGAGYVISGGTIALQRGGIAADESVAIDSALTLIEPQEWIAASGKTLTASGSIALGGNALTLTGDGDADLSGTISGTGALVKNGGGTLDLGAASTFTGGTRAEEGLVQLSAGGAAGAVRGILAVEAGAEVELTAANALGTTTGTKVNTLNINGGLVNNTAAGDNGWGLAVNMTGGELRSNGGTPDSGAAQLYSLGGGSAVNTLASSQSAVISGRVNLREGNADNRLTFNVADGAAAIDLLSQAAITESGSRAIAKSGLGVMELVAASTYSGGTRINAGLLLVNNAAGSATGSGIVELNGGTLGGTGTVAGAVSFTAQGGLIEPGNSTGTLTVGGLDMSSSPTAALRIEINGAADYDSLAVNGTVTLTGGVLAGAVSAPLSPTDLFFIIVNDAADAVVGTFDGIAQGGTVILGDYAFTVSYTGDSATQVTSGGNDVVLYNAADYTTALPAWREFSFPGYTRSTTLTNFPALIALQKGMEGFSYANFLSPNGDDLRFYSDQSKTVELNYEIDLWDTNGISYVWVQIPEFNSDTAIWANWGDAASNFKPGYTTDGSVWSEDFGAVWHMNEANIQDSSANSNDGTAYNSPAIVGTRIGRGLDLVAASNQDIRVPNHTTIDPPDNFTASVWCKTAWAGAWYRNIMGNFGASGGISPAQTFWGLGWMNGSHKLGFVNRVANATTEISGPTDRFSDGGWHLLTGQKEGSTMRFYVDGKLIVTGTRAGNVKNSEGIWFGWHGSTVNQHITATIDEARICNTVRSLDWIWACYANQSDALAFTGESAPAAYRDTHPSFGIQAGAVTWDSGTTAAWSADDALGSSPLLTWASILNNAYITGGASSITTVAPVTANRLVIESAGCSVSGGNLTLTRGLTAAESMTINNQIQVTDDQSWDIAGGKTVTVNNRIEGRVNFTKTGAGDLYLNAAGSDAYRLNSIVIDDGRIRFNTGGWTIDPFQDWPMTLTINEGGTARVELAHAFGNQLHWVRIVGGTLDLNAEQYLRDGSEMFGGQIIGSNQARLGGGRTLYIRNSDQTAVISAELSSMTSDNNLDVANGAQAVDLLISGKMVGLGFRKRGAGTAAITNSGNSYTNTTAIEAGTLLVNNSAGTGTGLSAVLINGGTLGGTGTVANKVSFGSVGGTIAPGNATGTLTANCNVDFTSAGATAFNVTIDDAAAGAYSQLAVNGTLTLNNTALNVVLNSEVDVGTVLPLIVNDGSDAIVGTFAGLVNGANLKIETGDVKQSFKIYYTADSATGAISGGNDVALVPISQGTLILLR